MYVPVPPDASPDHAQQWTRALQKLERDTAPGTRKALERYREAAAVPRLVDGARAALEALDAEALAHATRYDPMLFHLLGVLLCDGAAASMATVTRIVETTLAAPADAGPAPLDRVAGWCAARRVLSGAPAGAQLARRVQAAWRKDFASTLLGQLLDDAEVQVPDDADWDFSLTHTAAEGYAQVVGSSAGDLLAVFALHGAGREALVDRDTLGAPASVPALTDVRALRAHLDRCAHDRGLAWDWGRSHDANVDPYGSTVRIHGLRPPARARLEAWWLGRPPEQQPKKAEKPTRFDAFVPADAPAPARSALRPALERLEAACDLPVRAQDWAPLKALATDALLVRTLLAWLDTAPPVDETWFQSLGVVLIAGPPGASAILERDVGVLLTNQPTLRDLWDWLWVIRGCRPDHPAVTVLETAWQAAFTHTPGGRLLSAMGVSPPVDTRWEVALMARQEADYRLLGDCIVEILPHGFFRAEAHVAGPTGEAVGIPTPLETIEAVREHFDACAAQAKLAPWDFAVTWKPVGTTNGSIVKTKGFPPGAARRISSWFRGPPR